MSTGIFILVGSLAGAWLLGTIPFSYVVARLWGVQDLRQVGSGNVGATNVVRTVGWLPGILAFLLDLAKGVASPALVWLAVNRLASQTPEMIYAYPWMGSTTWMFIGGCLAIVGHVFSPWLGFRGGKGIATTLGVLTFLFPRAVLIMMGVAVVAILLTRYVSVGSLSAIALMPLAIYLLYPHRIMLGDALLTIVLTLFLFWTHRSNLYRLWLGQENPIRGSAPKKQ